MKKLLLLISLSSLLLSAPAYKGTLSFTQNDGTKFEGNLKGDEYFHWVEDKNGNIIKYNKKSKNYEYGVVKKIDGDLELLPSGLSVTQKKQDSSALKQNRSQVIVKKIDKKTLSEIWKKKRDKRPRRKK